MKTTTKNTGIVILAIALLLTSMGFTKTQKQEKTCYGYGYAYNLTTKVLYVSNIVSGVLNSSAYQDASDQGLQNQWQSRLRQEDDRYFTYVISKYGFYTDEEAVDKHRGDVIGDYKQKGFSIVNITFSYRKTAKN